MDAQPSREILRRSLLALGCFATLLFFFSPEWIAFVIWSRVPEFGAILEVRRGLSVLEQAAHPGAPIADSLHAVIQWRLLFPLIAHVLHLPPVALFSLAHVGALLGLGYVITILRRRQASWLETTIGTLVVGAASWFFVSTSWLGYFDSWVALALLAVVFAPAAWPVWVACLLAPWIDERFVMAAPLALACRWLARHELDRAALRWRSEIIVPLALLVAFIGVRFGWLSSRTAQNATISGYFGVRNYLDAPLGRIVLGVWDGLRVGWVLVVAAVWLIRPRWHAAALATAVLVFIGAGLATAQDYSRSMITVLPVAVLGLVLVLRDHRAWGPWRFIVPAAALLLPAHHVMNDRTVRILYLYSELSALDHPPLSATSELHELNAIHFMEQGELGRAEAELNLAMKLAHNPASPAKQRGVLYATLQRWDDAKRDFSTVIEFEPNNPDGWFLRSQVELALRQLDAARADFDHARAIAPPTWTQRSDVARFAKTLASQRTP